MSVEATQKSTAGPSTHVVATNTAPRVTPPDGPTFGEVMEGSAQQLLRGATAAVRVLPSGPLVAASVRPGAPSVTPSVTVGGSAGSGVGMQVAGSAEGPGGGHPGSSGTVGNPAVEGALERSQEMNMYMIELQERVSAQNRAFTTYSNVLKAKHDTVKNAINNIR